MATYKVHIKTEGDKTTYTTNATTLATVTYRADLGKYDITTPDNNTSTNTAASADKIARESITEQFSALGIVPKFIND